MTEDKGATDEFVVSKALTYHIVAPNENSTFACLVEVRDHGPAVFRIEAGGEESWTMCCRAEELFDNIRAALKHALEVEEIEQM